MPSPDPLITARLSLTWSSAVTVAEVTDRVGLTPSAAWTAGEARVSPSGHEFPKPHAESGWQLKVGPRRTVDMPAVLDELLAIVEPEASRLRDAVVELGLHTEVSLHIKMVDQTPIGTIGHHALALLDVLRADLDLDLYVVGESYDEPISKP